MAGVGSISGQPSFAQSSSAGGGESSTGDISGDFIIGGGVDLTTGKLAIIGGVVVVMGFLWYLSKR